MPRLFSGLEIPHTVAERLSHLNNGLKKARWIEPNDYHITLRFFGDIDERQAQDIADHFSAIRKPPFDVELRDIRIFGGDNPRTLYASVLPNPRLSALQSALEQMAQRAGCKPEMRKFTPHVTIARVKRVSRDALADWLSAYGEFHHPAFKIERFAIFSAQPSKGGGPYLVEEAFPLEES